MYFRVEKMNDPYDYLFKFLVIGSAGTGKSCLLHQFIENRFKEESSHTIGKHLLDLSSLADSESVFISYGSGSRDFDDQKLKKFTAEKKIGIINYNLLILRLL